MDTSLTVTNFIHEVCPAGQLQLFKFAPGKFVPFFIPEKYIPLQSVRNAYHLVCLLWVIQTGVWSLFPNFEKLPVGVESKTFVARQRADIAKQSVFRMDAKEEPPWMGSWRVRQKMYAVLAALSECDKLSIYLLK